LLEICPVGSSPIVWAGAGSSSKTLLVKYMCFLVLGYCTLHRLLLYSPVSNNWVGFWCTNSNLYSTETYLTLIYKPDSSKNVVPNQLQLASAHVILFAIRRHLQHPVPIKEHWPVPPFRGDDELQPLRMWSHINKIWFLRVIRFAFHAPLPSFSTLYCSLNAGPRNWEIWMMIHKQITKHYRLK
jgi:hypothetical protein